MNKKAAKSDNTVNHTTGTGVLLNTLMESSAEVGVKIYTNHKNKQLQFLIYSSPLRGTTINRLYEGTDLNEAIAIIQRATVFTDEQKKEANLKLPEGYNLVPLVDGNLALVNEHNEMIFGGNLQECLKKIENQSDLVKSIRLPL